MSGGVLARINVILAFIGLFIASMLSLSHLLDIQLPCGIGSGCDLVTQDPRSKLFGVPFAYYGLLGYSIILVVSLVRLFGPNLKPRLIHGLGYLLSGVGLLVSIGLTYFSIRSIHALCTWCLGSAITMSLLFVSHSLAALREGDDPRAARPALDLSLVLTLVIAVLFGLGFAAKNLRAEAKTIRVDRVALKELSEEELLPDDAHITGPPNSKAVVVMFGDLTCPVCQAAYTDIVELMKRRHDFRFAFRQLPLEFHPLARPAALISEMASERGRFWQYADACYRGEPSTVDDLVVMAAKLGLDSSIVRKRLKDDNDPAAQILERDGEVERKLGLHSTPSVFILIAGYYPEPIAYRGIEQMLDHNTAEALGKP